MTPTDGAAIAAAPAAFAAPALIADPTPPPPRTASEETPAAQAAQAAADRRTDKLRSFGRPGREIAVPTDPNNTPLAAAAIVGARGATPDAYTNGVHHATDEEDVSAADSDSAALNGMPSGTSALASPASGKQNGLGAGAQYTKKGIPTMVTPEGVSPAAQAQELLTSPSRNGPRNATRPTQTVKKGVSG